MSIKAERRKYSSSSKVLLETRWLLQKSAELVLKFASAATAVYTHAMSSFSNVFPLVFDMLKAFNFDSDGRVCVAQ